MSVTDVTSDFQLLDANGKAVEPGAPIWHLSSGFVGFFAGFVEMAGRYRGEDSVICIALHRTRVDGRTVEDAELKFNIRDALCLRTQDPFAPDAPASVKCEDYFGGCPTCGQSNWYLNVGRTHVGRCDEHKTCWCIGTNLFSSWCDETEKTWRENEELLRTYTEVEPVRSAAPSVRDLRPPGNPVWASPDEFPF